MRGLAVVSVILFHINKNIVPGGFSGVDIFFVISGFLITRIIVDGIRDGNFSMARFYARRVRRIFPALFTTLLSCTVMAVLAFDPLAYTKFFEELPYAVFQAANFLFVQQVGYFEAANETSPLLHTWSLGVEEQFYLIWPLLLILVFRFWKDKASYILTGLIVVSLFYSQFLCLNAPKAGFYMLYSRAWELAFGGLLVVADFPILSSRFINNLVAATGFLGVMIGFVLLDSKTQFPGIHALLPVLGTVLMLYSGQSRESLLCRTLAWKPFVAIGIISYSLYLWHWPVIVFVKNLTGAELNVVSGCIVFFISLLMASFSYNVVERPLRYGPLPRWPYHFRRTVNPSSRPGFNFCVKLSLFVGAPVLLTYLFVGTIFKEKNLAVTDLKMDVELLDSVKGSAQERITIYWQEKIGTYREQNSFSLTYDNAHKVAENKYHFEFRLPDLDKLKGVRVDPLTDRGTITITDIMVAGGFFKVEQNVDLRSLFDNVGVVSPDIQRIAYENNGLLVSSSGNDPYFTIFQSPLGNRFDFPIIFGLFFLLLTFFYLYSIFLENNQKNRAVLVLGGVTILLTLLSTLRLQYSNYSQWRFNDEKNTEFLHSATAMTEMAQFSESVHNNVVLLGDSHAGYYAFPVQRWSENNSYSFGVFAQPACPPLLYKGIGGEGDQSTLSDMYTSCTRLNNQYINEIIGDPEVKIVFISIRQEFYFSNPVMFLNKKGMKLVNSSETAEGLLKKSFAATIRSLVDGGKKVVILGQAPVLKESPQKCLSRNVTLLSLPYRETKTCDLDKDFSNGRLLVGKEFFQQLAKENDSVHYFYLSPNIQSIFGKDETILYYDDNHLSHKGSLYITPLLERDLQEFSKSI